MALSKTISKHIPLVGTIDVQSYCKVVELRGGKDLMSAMMEARQGSSAGELVDVFHAQFIPDLSGPNFIAQAYLHLKSLPEFAGATDC
jgi:hypothetical protein